MVRQSVHGGPPNISFMVFQLSVSVLQTVSFGLQYISYQVLNLFRRCFFIRIEIKVQFFCLLIGFTCIEKLYIMCICDERRIFFCVSCFGLLSLFSTVQGKLFFVR